MSDQDEGYEVVDKRGKTDGASDAQADDPEVEEGVPEQEQTTDVPSLLSYMLSLLRASAWQWMGLVMNPVNGKVEVDLKQARLAIDCFETISEKLSPFLEERGRREIQGALADLRVNFVERANAAGQKKQEN